LKQKSSFDGSDHSKGRSMLVAALWISSLVTEILQQQLKLLRKVDAFWRPWGW